MAIIGALVLAGLQSDQLTGVVGFINRVLNLGEIALFLYGVGSIIYNVIAWRSANYTVTNRRLMGQEGLLQKKETDSLLSSISDVRMRQTAVGRMLGYGDIQILSASGDSGADKFTTVVNAVELKKNILEQKVNFATTIARRRAAGLAQCPRRRCFCIRRLDSERGGRDSEIVGRAARLGPSRPRSTRRRKPSCSPGSKAQGATVAAIETLLLALLTSLKPDGALT